MFRGSKCSHIDHVFVLGSGEESSPRSSSEAIRGRIQRRNERGETPLHVACIKGDLKQVTALVGQGAEINATDNACEQQCCSQWEGREGKGQVC